MRQEVYRVKNTEEKSMKSVLEVLCSLLPTKGSLPSSRSIITNIVSREKRTEECRLIVDIIYQPSSLDSRSNGLHEFGLRQLQMVKVVNASYSSYVEFVEIIGNGVEVPLPQDTTTTFDYTIIVKEFGVEYLLLLLRSHLSSL